MARVENEIEFDKLITPYYQHAEGTSFAAPVVASIIACMLQANSALTPLDVRKLLIASAAPVPGAPVERQGHGAIQGGQAVALAAASSTGRPLSQARSPVVSGGEVLFRLHAAEAHNVRVPGSWDGWPPPGLSLEPAAAGWWQGRLNG